MLQDLHQIACMLFILGNLYYDLVASTPVLATVTSSAPSSQCEMMIPVWPVCPKLLNTGIRGKRDLNRLEDSFARAWPWCTGSLEPARSAMFTCVFFMEFLPNVLVPNI